jgi:hypothetical protein
MSMLTPRGAGARPLRGRRALRRLVPVVLLLAVAGAAGWYVWQYAASGTPDVQAKATRSCPAPGPAPVIVPAGDVKVNVYNSTDRRGLAARVARQLERRGFRVRKVDNDPAGRQVTGAAEVRHSTAGVDAARTVAAHVGEVVAVPDQRPGASVDLVLGAGFTRLLPAADAAAALSPTPQPRPAGC